jgi:DNA-binding CsgD family transcriptional regulator
MKQSSINADIQNLCNLGIDSQLIMPTLLQMLHELIPSAFNTFQWADHNGELSNCIYEPRVPASIIRLYLNYFYNYQEAKVHPTFTEAIKHEHGVTDWEQYYNDNQFLYSEYYNLIMQPLGIRYALRAYVPVEGRNSGVLILCRERNAKPFSDKDKSCLASIIPALTHALALRKVESPSFLENNQQSGMLILNYEGLVEYANPIGQHLLFLLAHDEINVRTVTNLHENTGPILKQLATCLIDRYNRHARVITRPMQIQNSWGLFILKAHLLHQLDSSDKLIGVTLQMGLPWQIQLLKAMQQTPSLAIKQREACLWRIEGLSQNNIASKMGVSPHSVNDFLKVVYRKLNVHNKEGLVKKLLTAMN